MLRVICYHDVRDDFTDEEIDEAQREVNHLRDGGISCTLESYLEYLEEERRLADAWWEDQRAAVMMYA